MEFTKFPSIPRLFRGMSITEKIDGTNASVFIDVLTGDFRVGSRKRWIKPGDDNFGFAAWAYEHQEELRELGDGTHYGEWWGQGIQRKYGLDEKRFSLFNAGRWTEENTPECVSVVPTLYEGPFDTGVVHGVLEGLHMDGSVAAPGFMKPEGIVVWHDKARILFKVTLDHNDDNKFIHAEDPRA